MRRRLIALLTLTLPAALLSIQGAFAAGFAYGPAMQAAADADKVPLPLVQAIAYVNSRWEPLPKTSVDGGVGPMNIHPYQIELAASLSGLTPDQVRADPAANLRAGGAFLANYHTSGSDLASWQPAVAMLLGDGVATQVYEALRTGESRTTTAGERITLAPQPLPAGSRAAASAPAASSSPDYPPAGWVPASTANFSVANRPRDYPVDMIIIHDTEGSYASAIAEFQNPAAQSSAHYVTSDAGNLTQMVREHDIAWHAGNWDYNTRAIGIEHEGYAWSCCWYTAAMYNTSAALAASICSRWGVPMDRNHVIGHNEVPDPNDPNQFGGSGHHTDPGPYWDWNYYLATAQADANGLPSPPHMVETVDAVGLDQSASLNWSPARTCRSPITSYHVVAQPGNLTQDLPGTATGTTFTGLQNGGSYTFTVTAINAYGQDSLVSNPAYPSPTINKTYFNWYDSASAGMWNDNIHLVNPGTSLARGFLSLPGYPYLPFSVGAGSETYLSWPDGVIGGPLIVNLQSGPKIVASQRVAYYDSFNEVVAKDSASAATVSYFNWYDHASPGMWNDNIHVLNPGGTAASGSISMPGAPAIPISVPAGGEGFYSWPQGVIGGPVTVTASVPVIASQRVAYYQSFNEVPAKTSADAGTKLYFNWYDKASPDMWNDNIHVLNPLGSTAVGTISTAGAPDIAISIPAHGEAYYTWPQGTIGGPVTVTASTPVIASQRVAYGQSFNEVMGRSPSTASAVSYFNWYDKASPGMWNDNVHIVNPGQAAVTGTITIPGQATIGISIPAGGEAYYTWPQGTIGGPVTIRASAPVIASQRVAYWQSFNEVIATPPPS